MNGTDHERGRRHREAPRPARRALAPGSRATANSTVPMANR
ncbi:hypothetical protein BX266_0522 [Streptomyces sp. TLI_171]|nr:hypothetical protein BX266_0522 [Streptomyces sp. TLI_171]